jgi:hypothetical protein
LESAQEPLRGTFKSLAAHNRSHLRTRRIVVSQVLSTVGCYAVYIGGIDSLEAILPPSNHTLIISILVSHSLTVLQHTFFHFITWFFCLIPNRTSSRVGFRFPSCLSSTHPCSAQDNTPSLNPTVLPHFAAEEVAAGGGTQCWPIAIGSSRLSGSCLTLNLTGERLRGVRVESIVDSRSLAKGLSWGFQPAVDSQMLGRR